MNDIKVIRFDNLHDIELPHVFECGQCFRWNECEDGSIHRVLQEVMRHTFRSSMMAIRARLSSSARAVVRSIGIATLIWIRTNGAMKKALLAGEPKLAKSIDVCHGIRILNQDYWEVLISFIVSQNNNIPRIKKCIESLAKNYGTEIGEFMGEVRYAFPTPEQLSGPHLKSWRT